MRIFLGEPMGPIRPAKSERPARASTFWYLKKNIMNPGIRGRGGAGWIKMYG